MENKFNKPLIARFEKLADHARARNSGGQKIEEKETGKVSMEEAMEIIGRENFYGPIEIAETFPSLEAWKNANIPEIQFSKAELERAKDIGHELILYVDHDAHGNFLTGKRIKELCGGRYPDGNKTSKGDTFVASDWFETDSVASKEKPRFGWRLSEKEPLKSSANRDYIGQTEEIVNHLTDVVFRDGVPPEYEEAINEFDAIKTSLHVPAKSSNADEWKPAAEKLGNLKINQLCRENFAEVLYRLALHEKKTGERLLDSKDRSVYYTWTNSRASDGDLVLVGYFDSDGASCYGWRPRRADSGLGVCFSRS